jgi:hypothetical protein
MYASYFAQCRMIAFSLDVSQIDKVDAAQRDLLAIGPDAILLFGTRGNAANETFLAAINTSQPNLVSEAILDPPAREVEKLLWRVDHNH